MNGSNSRSRATRSAWSSMLSFAARNALWFAATRSVIVSVAIRAVVLPDRSREKRLHRLAGREGRSAACARTGRVTALGAWQKFGVRNAEMAKRIEETPFDEPLRFAFAGDSGAWVDPAAEAIFAQLVRQVGECEPLFFANLGDFAGPGTLERHQAYLRLVEALRIPNICVVGNHDLDDPTGWALWEQVHGPMNFEFGLGYARFVAIHAAARPGRHDHREPPEAVQGPREEDLHFLESALSRADEPHRVVLMHMRPYLDGRYAPHENWGFGRYESEFLQILRRHRVKLVCCAHGLAFDEHVHDGVRFVMSGGGGSGLCSHRRGSCTEGDGRPEDRGALFHFVEITIADEGTVSGRAVQAFAAAATPRITFGDAR